MCVCVWGGGGVRLLVMACSVTVPTVFSGGETGDEIGR